MEHQLKLVLTEQQRQRLDQIRGYLSMCYPEYGYPTNTMVFGWLVDSAPIETWMHEFTMIAPTKEISRERPIERVEGESAGGQPEVPGGGQPARRPRGRPRKRA